MTDWEVIQSAVKRVALAQLLLLLNLNLGTLNILPNWLGYVLILNALPDLSRADASAALLRPLGIILALWEGLLWVLALFGAQGADVLPAGQLVSVIIGVVSLYFHFQLLTNLANIAEMYACPERQRLLTLRSARTILITALFLPLPWETNQTLTTITALVHIIVAVWIWAVLASLKESLAQP